MLVVAQKRRLIFGQGKSDSIKRDSPVRSRRHMRPYALEEDTRGTVRLRRLRRASLSGLNIPRYPNPNKLARRVASKGGLWAVSGWRRATLVVKPKHATWPNLLNIRGVPSALRRLPTCFQSILCHKKLPSLLPKYLGSQLPRCLRRQHSMQRLKVSVISLRAMMLPSGCGQPRLAGRSAALLERMHQH